MVQQTLIFMWSKYKRILKEKSLPLTSSLLALAPIVKNDLMCVGGRVNQPDLTNSSNQIIICKSKPIPKLHVKECREKIFHVVIFTLATIRKKIWIHTCRDWEESFASLFILQKRTNKTTSTPHERFTTRKIRH